MPTKMSTVDADGRYIYCYCKEDKGGDMIGCDNKECSFGEWFHLGCSIGGINFMCITSTIIRSL